MSAWLPVKASEPSDPSASVKVSAETSPAKDSAPLFTLRVTEIGSAPASVSAMLIPAIVPLESSTIEGPAEAGVIFCKAMLPL